MVNNAVTGKQLIVLKQHTETVQAGAVTPSFSMNSVAMDCPGYAKQIHRQVVQPLHRWMRL